MTILKRGVLLIAFLLGLAAPQAASALMFTPAAGSPVTASGTPIGMSAAGDLDGDGRDDLAYVAGNGQEIYIALAADGETFTETAGSPLEAGSWVESIRVADVDRDGNADLLTGSFPRWDVWLGDGSGEFGPAPDSSFNIPLSVPNSTGTVNAYSNVVGDVDGDGDPDLVFGMYDTNFDVALNDGTGAFTPQAPGSFLPADQHAKFDGMYAPALGDFNGDGHADLAAALWRDGGGSTSSGIYLATGDGSGTFTPDGKAPLLSGRPAPIHGMSAVQLDAGPGDDLVATTFDSWPDNNVESVLGSPAGLVPNPAPTAGLYAGSGTYQQGTGDFDQDGRMDIVAGIRGEYRAAVLRNDGNGGIIPFPGSPFDLPPVDGNGFSVNAIYSGDFNGDGFPDIAGDSSHSSQAWQARGIDVLISRPHVVTPENAMWGNLPVGSSSVQPISIENGGAPPATLGTATITGPDADQFSLGPDQCGSTIPGGGTCTREVVFGPTSAGEKQATLTLEADGQADLTVALSGTGVIPVPPRISLKLSSAGRVKAGRTLAVKARVTNLSGGAPVHGVSLKTSVPAKLAVPVKPAEAGDLGPGMSLTRTLRIKVRKTAKKGRKLKVTVTAAAPGIQPARAVRTVRIR